MKFLKKVPFWGWIVLMIAAFLLVAVLIPSEEKAKPLANEIEYGEVDVAGAKLKTGETGGDLPTIKGQSLTGEDMVIENTGKPQIVFIVAHWCPHCQKEVPLIVKSLKSQDMTGIDLRAVSTAADKDQDNYSPGTWLKQEGWKIETMADNELQDAAKALGVEGFPTFVLVDTDGKVVEHKSGELSVQELEDLWDQARNLR